MKVIDGIIPIEIQIEDDGTVYVMVFPGEIDVHDIRTSDTCDNDGDGHKALDLVYWDDPKTWIAV